MHNETLSETVRNIHISQCAESWIHRDMNDVSTMEEPGSVDIDVNWNEQKQSVTD